jgi:hypothetical protein
MPPRNRKKSRAKGLYKQCRHLSWDRCECPWWGRFKGHRVSLEKWAGTPIPSKELAKKVLARLQAAVLDDTFDKRSEHVDSLSSATTFGAFLDEYTTQHIDAERLRSNSVKSYIGVLRATFGDERLRVLAADPYRFEKWLKGMQHERKWENA